MGHSQAAAAQRARSGGQAREVPWPLPVRGLHHEAKSSEISGNMASVMDNWQSTGVALEMRDGYAAAAAGTARQRIPFEFDGAQKYIDVKDDYVICGDHIYRRPFAGDVSHTDISSNVLMVDGSTPILRYNGERMLLADFTIDPEIDKDTSEFNGIFSHQDRIYLWDDSELAFYYGGVGAVEGELTRFPLDRLGNIKGTIKIMTSMTINAAHGMNDILVIVTSTGTMILYEGVDPGDARDWRLLARVKVAAPVSKFAVSSFGADVWLLTVRGVVSVRDSLARGAMALVSSIGKPISDMIIADIKAFKTLSGWQMHPREDGSLFYMNTPTATGFKQYVFDIENSAWTTSYYPAKWFHDLGGETGFTHADGRLCLFVDGGDDGADITAILHTAWIRVPGFSEVAYMIPTIIADGDLEVRLTVLSDHDETPGDIEQGTQTFTMRPDNAGARVALNDLIGVNVAGRVFQARFEVTGKSVSFESLLVGLA